ncbi:hypothetical protein H3C61_01805 [Candidatus Gracilibacteria bacterium]|nr:hypothetical protein [Candidatus Gracilibacteria bacterium]
MIKKIINKYYNFFDNTLGDTTIVVGFIGLMIFLVGFLGNTNASFKGNILEYNKKQENIISIDGVKYKLHLEKLN